jgi:hypothetical protein
MAEYLFYVYLWETTCNPEQALAIKTAIRDENQEIQLPKILSYLVVPSSPCSHKSVILRLHVSAIMLRVDLSL